MLGETLTIQITDGDPSACCTSQPRQKSGAPSKKTTAKNTKTAATTRPSAHPKAAQTAAASPVMALTQTPPTTDTTAKTSNCVFWFGVTSVVATIFAVAVRSIKKGR